MKTIARLIAPASALFIVCAASGQQREYFSDRIFDPETEIPVAFGADYYDNIVKNRPIYELSFDEWFNGPHALAHWFGARRLAENNGVVPSVSYVGNFAANPSGGLSRGAANSSSVNLALGLDLEKISGKSSLKGWSIGNTWVWRFGRSLTKDKIGNIFNVQQNYGSQTIQMQSLFADYVKEFLADWRLSLKFGRFAAGDNFMTKPIYWLYQNNAFDGNPVGVFYQTKFSAYPASAWAAFSQISRKSGEYAKAGVYKINTDEQAGAHGLDFGFRGGGVNANFEAGKDFNHDASGKSPANVSAGLVSQWCSNPHIDNPMESSPFNCSLYVQADCMVWNMGYVKRGEARYIERESDKWRDLRGVVLWGALQYDPFENLARMPFFANGGILFNAPFESRADDVLCFGAAYGKLSDKYIGALRGSHEIALELNYKFQLNRFAFLQPNLQYILNAGGGTCPDAFVVGLQFGFNL
ncbi:MAG: carbohydrate porin [Opitutales bacterium]|nr:carbohydrate porin [Opitutales bacterium]